MDLNNWDIHKARPGYLAGIIDLDATGEDLWGPDDLAALLRHRLAAPADFDAGVVAGEAGAASAGPGFRSVGELLGHPCPPPELLERMIGEAGGGAAGPCGSPVGLPREVAAVLYFAAFAAALVRCGRRLTRAEDGPLARGLRWAAGQPWADDATRGLCRDALRLLEGDGGPAGGGSPDYPGGPPGPGGEAPSPAESQAESFPWPLPHRPQVRGYQITGRLGEGGMGVVWRAVQIGTRRPVALKVLPPWSLGSVRAVRRFEREVELAGRLQHPHIARVYDGGACDAGNRAAAGAGGAGGAVGSGGALYYAMELIEGRHLDRHVAGRRLAVREVLALFRDVCRAVQYAHQKGVIHRDLKPSNILVTDDGQPHVVDFGLARDVADGPRAPDLTLTAAGQCAGTPAFMSPEQAAGQLDRLDTRSDVYSLGATLYLLLTGQTPHDTAGPDRAVLDRIAREEVRRPGRVKPGAVDAELEAILLKALAREPERRYASAGGMADDLGRYLAGEPVSARPPTLAYLIARRVRRHRAALTLAGLVVMGLLAVVVGAYVRVERARRVAVAQGEVAGQQRAVADQQRVIAEAERRRAAEKEAQAVEERNRAEREWADGLVAQADAKAEAGRWPEAVELYDRASGALAGQGRSTLPADSGLLAAYRAAPPPLAVPGADDFRAVPPGAPATAANGEPVGAYEAALGSVAVSSDGATVASGGNDGTVKIWGLPTGRLLHVLTAVPPPGLARRGSHREVGCLAFSPDGTTLASGGADEMVRLWDVRSGAQRGRLVYRDNAWGFGMTRVRFSPDGRLLAATGEIERCRVWALAADDPAGGRVLSTSDYGRLTDRPARDVVFCPDGRRCLTIRGDGTIWCFDAARGTRDVVFEPRADGDHAYRCVAVSDDGRLILAGGRADRGFNPSVELWDARSGRHLRNLGTHPSNVEAVAFAPGDAGLAISVGADGTLRVWETATGKLLRTVWFGGGRSAVRAADFSRDRSVLVTGGDDGVLRAYDVGAALGAAGEAGEARDGSGQSAASPDLPLATSSTPVASSAAALGDRVILTGASDGTLRVWDVESGRLLRDFPPRHAAGGPEPHPDPSNAPGTISALAASPDGRLALAGDNGHALYLWDLGAGEGRRVGMHADKVRAVAFSADGCRAVSHDGDQIRTWDLSDPAAPRPLKVWRAGVTLEYGVAFSPDGSRVLAVSHHGVALAWDAATGLWLPNPGNWNAAGEMNNAGAAFSADGSRALAAREESVPFWDAFTGRRVWDLSGHRGRVQSVALCPGGRWAASAGDDGTARLWDLSTGREARAFGGATHQLLTVGFTRDGRRLFAGGFDGTLHVWDLGRPQAYRDFERRLPAARRALRARPDDPEALKTLGEWWAFRGRWDWAAPLLEEARARGAAVSSLTLARCCQHLNRVEDARRAFRAARDGGEAPGPYLDACLRALEPGPAAQPVAGRP